MRRFETALLKGCLVVSLAIWTGVANAAQGDEGKDALDPAALDSAVADLQREHGLSQVEARELLQGAAKDVLEKPQLDLDTKDSPLTEQEQGLMGQVNAMEQDLRQKGLSDSQIHQEIETKMGDKLREAFPRGESDSRLKELSERGVPGMERASGLEQRGGSEQGGAAERGSMERHQAETPSRETTREAPSRESHDARETPSREAPSRETPSREVERPTVERPAADPAERPTMERSPDGPQMERSPQEAPHY